MGDGIWNATGGMCEDDDDIDLLLELFGDDIEDDDEYADEYE